MEIQVLDDGGSQYTNLRPAQYHGSIYQMFPAKRGFQKPVGEWNTEEITAKGRHITVKLNGTTIVDANLDDVKDEAMLAKHRDLNEAGRLARHRQHQGAHRLPRPRRPRRVPQHPDQGTLREASSRAPGS